MKIFCYISIFFLIIFSSCKKDGNNAYGISYHIVETSPGSGPYSVRYTLSDGTLRSEGGLTTENWMTANMTGYKKGSIVQLYLDAPPNGSYDMIIYIDGAVSARGSADGGIGEQVLEAQIPN